jgi:hypothetical protein
MDHACLLFDIAVDVLVVLFGLDKQLLFSLVNLAESSLDLLLWLGSSTTTK